MRDTTILGRLLIADLRLSLRSLQCPAQGGTPDPELPGHLPQREPLTAKLDRSTDIHVNSGTADASTTPTSSIQPRPGPLDEHLFFELRKC